MEPTEKQIKYIRSIYANELVKITHDISQSVIAGLYTDLAEELHEALKPYEILTKIEYSPIDNFGGSLGFWISTIPDENYILKLWYEPKDQCYMIAFFRRLSGSLEQFVPNTITEEGIGRLTDLDKFIDYFVPFLARESYNRTNKKVFK